MSESGPKSSNEKHPKFQQVFPPLVHYTLYIRAILDEGEERGERGEGAGGHDIGLEIRGKRKRGPDEIENSRLYVTMDGLGYVYGRCT